MAHMQAVRVHQYGGPEVVRLDGIPRPKPAPDEVLVRVHAAGVNPLDWKIRAGYLQQVMPLPLPFTLGADISGVVEAIGDGTLGFSPGDEVFGQSAVFSGGSGAFAEFATAPATAIERKPAALSHIEAAALPVAGVSAWQAVTEHLSISHGQHVLIHGGAGGVGAFAIQIAKYLGARVTATASAHNIDYVRSLGADEVIDYRSHAFDQNGHKADAVLDTVGGETYERSFRILRPGGRIVSLLEPPRQALMNEYGVQASILYGQVTLDRLSALGRLAGQGALRVHVDRTYPLAQASDALLHVERSSIRGKTVLRTE